jgi:SAM-dependent methyltransferase
VPPPAGASPASFVPPPPAPIPETADDERPSASVPPAASSKPGMVVAILPAADLPQVNGLPEPDEEFAPLAAMPIIAVFAEEELVDEPPPSSLPLPEPPRVAPGIETATDPGWTPAPAVVTGVFPPAPAVPAVAVIPSAEVIEEIPEISDEDVAPESDNPEPPRPAPVLSTPPRPPPPPPGSAPSPPRIEAAPKTVEVDVDVSEDLGPDLEPAPISITSVTSLDAPPRPPPPPPVSAQPPVAPPPPPAVPPPPPSGPKVVEARPMPPKQPADKKRARPWWEEMFDDDFLRSIKQPTAGQIEDEVAFIDDRLGLRHDALILDLACGDGRHAVGLARRGYKVVGFDLSLAMMARAQEEAESAGQKINFLHGDMREMNFENQFDGVYFWGMSFGYFDEEKNFSVVQRIHRALRPGGVLLIDVCNRDFIAPRQPNMVWFEGDGCICMDETNLDSLTSRLKVKRTVMLEDGRTRELDFSIRLYGLHELGKVLHEAGFKVLEVSGHIATPGVFFGSESPRSIVLAERS